MCPPGYRAGKPELSEEMTNAELPFGPQVEVDKNTRAVYITLRDGTTDHTTEVDDGVLYDYDYGHNLIGIEVLR